MLRLLTSLAVVLCSGLASADIKSEIISLSYTNMTNNDNRPEIRQQLNGLVARLTENLPDVTEEQIAFLSPGSWRQIWSDERDNSPPGAPQRDLSHVYQVVGEGGWGFNFGVRLITPEQPITFALSVAASVSGNQQTTEITKAFLRTSGMTFGESLEQLANEIREGKSKDFVEREAGKFPNGPIGAKGVLTILYIDEDLKIGTAPNVYSGLSEMFVMKRQAFVDNGKLQ